jgi:hypothetical protein
MILKGKTQVQVNQEKQIATWKMIIEDSKKNLAETDWVVIKLHEYQITNPNEYDAIFERYRPILDTREKIRQDINHAEEELRNMGAL